jgi:hypothetical protein
MLIKIRKLMSRVMWYIIMGTVAIGMLVCISALIMAITVVEAIEGESL